MSFLQDAINALRRGQVKFVVIGGVAMGAHGSAHVTFDLDVCYERSKENIERLVETLVPLNPTLRGAPEGLPFRFDVETVVRGLNFILKTDIGDFDLLGEVLGLGFYPDVLASSVEVELFGDRCRVLSLDGLIKTKRLAGRTKDLIVIPELEALLELEKGGHPGSDEK